MSPLNSSTGAVCGRKAWCSCVAMRLPRKSEKRNATGAAMAPPFPAMRPAQKRIAPATPRRITGGTGSGSVNAHQNASPIALAATDANTRGSSRSHRNRACTGRASEPSGEGTEEDEREHRDGDAEKERCERSRVCSWLREPGDDRVQKRTNQNREGSGGSAATSGEETCAKGGE